MKGRGERRGSAVAAGVALASALLSGCASPGPPLPPSLKLPEIVTGLTASRVGDEVRLRWTTPSRTTDKLLIAGPVVAEICRETPAVAPSAPAKAAQNSAMSVGKNAASAPCSPVLLRVQVTPGASEAVDVLPASLTAAPARLLAYRVQLRNAAGRTAGASPAVFAASGPAPQAVEDLRGKATKAGVVLEWKAEAQETGNREQGTEGTESIELDRTILQPATANTTTTTASTSPTTTAGSGLERKGGLPGATKEPSESRFRAGGELADAGGTVDRTALIGHAYRYTAQRVRSVELGGQKLELRGVASVEVTVAMKDVFPPGRRLDWSQFRALQASRPWARLRVRARRRLANRRRSRRSTSPGSRIWSRASQATASIGAIWTATLRVCGSSSVRSWCRWRPIAT